MSLDTGLKLLPTTCRKSYKRTAATFKHARSEWRRGSSKPFEDTRCDNKAQIVHPHNGRQPPFVNCLLATHSLKRSGTLRWKRCNPHAGIQRQFTQTINLARLPTNTCAMHIITNHHAMSEGYMKYRNVSIIKKHIYCPFIASSVWPRVLRSHNRGWNSKQSPSVGSSVQPSHLRFQDNVSFN